jgi:hypothetical protein
LILRGERVACGARISSTRLMRDLTDSRWIKIKGLLFLVIGVIAAVLLWLESPTWKTALLLALVIWSFCRCYYFAFYVGKPRCCWRS